MFFRKVIKILIRCKLGHSNYKIRDKIQRCLLTCTIKIAIQRINLRIIKSEM